MKLPLLIDFDGVVRLGNVPAPDVKDLFNFIDKKQIPACVISNSTLKTSSEIKDFFYKNGIEFKIPAVTASEAALKYAQSKYKKVKVYCTENIKKLFADLLVEENPEAVIVGDLSDGWSYDILNEIFRDVHSGADFIAMQKNKYWKPDGETLCLDAGSFISAIEYATSKEALLIGKPSPIYFRTALKMLGDENSNFFMLGDDLETDALGAKQIGGKAILIFTGKTKSLTRETENLPDYKANNLTDVIRILEKFH
jgi:HAD superfamily hydrolase (TIGR01458 family)